MASPAPETVSGGHPHTDARSLAATREAVAMVDANPALIGQAMVNLVNWAARCRNGPSRAIMEWQDLLFMRTWKEVRALLLQEDPGGEGQRLRSTSPFVSLLPPGRWEAIVKEHPASACRRGRDLSA